MRKPGPSNIFLAVAFTSLQFFTSTFGWFGISYEEFSSKIATWVVDVAMPLETNLPDLVALGKMEKPPLGSVFEDFLSKTTEFKLLATTYANTIE